MLCQESEADMNEMNRNWKQLEWIDQDRCGWSMLVGNICSFTAVNRHRYAIIILLNISTEILKRVSLLFVNLSMLI